MRRQLFMLAIFIGLRISLFGQIFTGTSTDKYRCEISIAIGHGDSNAVFKYNLDNNVVYAEYYGKIKKIKDSLYHISARMYIGQFFMKSINADTLYIQIDTANVSRYDNIVVIYANGKRTELRTQDNGKKISLIKFAFDKKLFNRTMRNNSISLSYTKCVECFFPHLICKIPYGSSASFEAGDKIELDIIMFKDKLWTVDTSPLQTGHFKLTKEK
jgi:hypothetical protein